MQSSCTADAIIASARSWCGTPFRHQADVKGLGVDCVQFLIASYRAVGALPPEFQYRVYPRGWFLRDSRYLDLLAPYTLAREGTPQPADIALFRVGRAPAHAAIVIDWPRVIHADPERGVVETDAMHGGMPGPFLLALQPKALAGGPLS